MKQLEKMTENLTYEMISKMFCEYVNSMEDKERHTKKACAEVEAFDKFCEKEFLNNVVKQTEAYDKMMNVAVEFEESGFIAGVKWILAMLKENSIT